MHEMCSIAFYIVAYHTSDKAIVNKKNHLLKGTGWFYQRKFNLFL